MTSWLMVGSPSLSLKRCFLLERAETPVLELGAPRGALALLGSSAERCRHLAGFIGDCQRVLEQLLKSRHS